MTRKEEVETLGNVMDLVTRNMAIDITEGIKDKKEVASNVKVRIICLKLRFFSSSELEPKPGILSHWDIPYNEQ